MKMEWKKPVLEDLSVNMTMTGGQSTKWWWDDSDEGDGDDGKGSIGS